MKNRIKLYIFSLVIIITVCSVATSVLAAETTLNTTVPTRVPVELIITGKGSVTIGDTIYSKSTFAEVQRHKEVSYIISPADGYYIENVEYCGVDVTNALENNTYTVSQVGLHDALTVTFAPISDIPSTGDDSNVNLLIFMMLASAIAFAATLKERNIVK